MRSRNLLAAIIALSTLVSACGATNKINEGLDHLNKVANIPTDSLTEQTEKLIKSYENSLPPPSFFEIMTGPNGLIPIAKLPAIPTVDILKLTFKGILDSGIMDPTKGLRDLL